MPRGRKKKSAVKEAAEQSAAVSSAKKSKEPKVDPKFDLFIKDKRWSKGDEFTFERVRAEGIGSRFINLNLAFTGTRDVLFEWGRMAEITGEDDCGKTTFCIQVGVDFQNQFNEPWFFCDSEKRLNATYAKALGADPRLMHVKRPATGEEAFEQLKEAVKTGYRFIVNDSIPGNVPMAIMTGKAEDHHMGLHARLVSKETSVLRHLVAKHKAVILFVNQLTNKIGSMGDPLDTRGGRALKYWLSYRARFFDPRGDKVVSGDLSAYDTERVDDDQKRLKELGKDVRVKILKNKSAAPWTETKMRLFYGKGFDEQFSRLSFYADLGLIKMSDTGKSIEYKGKDIAHKTFFDKVISDEKFMQAVAEKLKE